MSESIHRSLTLLTGVPREVHKPKRVYPAGGRKIDLKTKRYIHGAIEAGKSNKQIRDELASVGVMLSMATVRNYREDGPPADLWDDETLYVNKHGQFAAYALKDYGVTPGTSWKISQAEDGTVTLKPA